MSLNEIGLSVIVAGAGAGAGAGGNSKNYQIISVIIGLQLFMSLNNYSTHTNTLNDLQ